MEEEEEEREEAAHRKSQKATDMRLCYDDDGINTFCPEARVPTNRARAMNLRVRAITFPRSFSELRYGIRSP